MTSSKTAHFKIPSVTDATFTPSIPVFLFFICGSVYKSKEDDVVFNAIHEAGYCMRLQVNES
jgi:hypothetical protein